MITMETDRTMNLRVDLSITGSILFSIIILAFSSVCKDIGFKRNCYAALEL